MRFIAFMIIAFIVSGCEGSGGDGGDHQNTPVYVTLAVHLEDNPEFANCNAYPAYRQDLLDFAEEISVYVDAVDLQSDYEFFTGVENCETPELMETTGGKNILDYLADTYGFVIDAHQEGGWEEGEDNYADVRYMAGQATSSVTETVGGFVWQDSDQIETLESGETGRLHPEFTWYPEILTLGVGARHHLFGDFTDDDLTSGVWRPAGGSDSFYEHDPNRRLVYVGPGQQHSSWNTDASCSSHSGAFRNTVEYVKVLLSYIQEGILPEGKIYTATLAIPQKAVFEQEGRAALLGHLEALKPLIDSGDVIIATYQEVVDIWINEYKGEPNIVRFESIDPSDYTCPSGTNVKGFILIHGDPQEILQLHDNFDVARYDYDGNGMMEDKDMWLALMDLVDRADGFGHRLTLQLSPPYIDYITGPECDALLGSGREYPEGSGMSYNRCLDLVQAWGQAGHEISIHHHGVNHDPLKFDGYTNRTIWNTNGQRPCLDNGVDCSCGAQGCFWCVPPASELVCTVHEDPPVLVGYDPEWRGPFNGPGGMWERIEDVFGDGAIRSICINHQDEESDMPDDPDIIYTTQGGGFENDPDIYPLCVAYDPEQKYHDAPKYTWFYRHELINTRMRLEDLKALVNGATGDETIIGMVFHVSDFVRSEVEPTDMTYKGVHNDLLSFLSDPDGDGDTTDRVQIGTLSQLMVEAGKTEAPDPCVETCFTLDPQSPEASYTVPVPRPPYCD